MFVHEVCFAVLFTKFSQNKLQCNMRYEELTVTLDPRNKEKDTFRSFVWMGKHGLPLSKS